jgi:hypothetical protein
MERSLFAGDWPGEKCQNAVIRSPLGSMVRTEYVPGRKRKRRLPDRRLRGLFAAQDSLTNWRRRPDRQRVGRQDSNYIR